MKTSDDATAYPDARTVLQTSFFTSGAAKVSVLRPCSHREQCASGNAFQKQHCPCHCMSQTGDSCCCVASLMWQFSFTLNAWTLWWWKHNKCTTIIHCLHHFCVEKSFVLHWVGLGQFKLMCNHKQTFKKVIWFKGIKTRSNVQPCHREGQHCQQMPQQITIPPGSKCIVCLDWGINGTKRARAHCDTINQSFLELQQMFLSSPLWWRNHIIRQFCVLSASEWAIAPWMESLLVTLGSDSCNAMLWAKRWTSFAPTKSCIDQSVPFQTLTCIVNRHKQWGSCAQKMVMKHFRENACCAVPWQNCTGQSLTMLSMENDWSEVISQIVDFQETFGCTTEVLFAVLFEWKTWVHLCAQQPISLAMIWKSCKRLWPQKWQVSHMSTRKRHDHKFLENCAVFEMWSSTFWGWTNFQCRANWHLWFFSMIGIISNHTQCEQSSWLTSWSQSQTRLSSFWPLAKLAWHNRWAWTWLSTLPWFCVGPMNTSKD